MLDAQNNKCLTATHILVPLFLVALTLVILFGVQSAQIRRDREAMAANITQQDKPLGEVQKLKTQVSALITGTMKLAEQGNKDAKDIVDKLKQAGIIQMGQQQPSGAPGAPPMTAPPSPTPAPPAPPTPAPPAPPAPVPAKP